LQSLRCWLTTAHASIQVIHKCSIGFKFNDLNGQGRDGSTRVYRRRNERFARNCGLEVDNFSRGSGMMSGAISYAEALNWCTSTTALAPQEPAAVLAEFTALVDDCTCVDPSHSQMFYWVQI
jgi:hypothetical protein